MYDEVLAEALVNGEHTLMRRRLRPFCLWHQLLLEISGTPLMFGGRPVHWQDIELASRICSCRYLETPAPPGYWWSLVRAIGLEYHDQLASFFAYLKDYNATPEFWDRPQPKGGGRKTAPDANPMPFCLSITARNLMLGSARTLAEAWEMPRGLAIFYACAYSNFKGADLDWMTAAQRKLIADETANPGSHFNKGTPPAPESSPIIIPGGYNGGRRD